MARPDHPLGERNPLTAFVLAVLTGGRPAVKAMAGDTFRQVVGLGLESLGGQFRKDPVNRDQDSPGDAAKSPDDPSAQR